MSKDRIFKNTMLALGVILIILGVIASLRENVTGGSVVIVTGLALLILNSFEIESIKLLGLETKLRSTLNEAQEVLEKLRGISVPVSEIALSVAVMAGRWGGRMSGKELHDYVMTIEEQLSQMGIAPHDISKVKKIG